MNTLALLTPSNSLVLDLGWSETGKRLDLGMERGHRAPGCSPGGAVVAIVGACSNSIPEAAQTSDGSMVARTPATITLSSAFPDELML